MSMLALLTLRLASLRLGFFSSCKCSCNTCKQEVRVGGNHGQSPLTADFWIKSQQPILLYKYGKEATLSQ